MADTLQEGVKFDDGKDPWHLVPWDAVKAITKVLLFGSRKYAPRNWEKGMAWSRCYRACIGHLQAWFMGEGNDPETGYSHLWHAGCCILFLITYELRGIGTDDRPAPVARPAPPAPPDDWADGRNPLPEDKPVDLSGRGLFRGRFARTFKTGVIHK